MSEMRMAAPEIPQDVEPGLGGVIAYGPATAFMRQITDLGEVAATRGTAEAEATLAALRRLAAVLEAEPIAGPPTARDIALLSLGEAIGRWKAAEEQKGGKVRARQKQAGQKKGAQATKEARARDRAEEAARLKAFVAEASQQLSHTKKLLRGAEALGLGTHKIATLRDMCPTPTNKKGRGLPS